MNLRIGTLLGLFLTSSLFVACVRSEDAPSVPGEPKPVVNATAEPAKPNDDAAAAPAEQQGKNVVLWISTDGCRGDYVDRGETPFLRSLMDHGDYSQKLTPMFPSLTFPSHSTEATGVPAGVHGITSNKFYDMTIGQEFNLPSDPTLLMAEPMWLTASRQGVRTAVMDWPFSQMEDKLPEGSPRAAYYNEKFDTKLTDTERLEKLVDAYRKDSENPETKEPLRLLMGYCFSMDHAGHGDGPESEGENKAIRETDGVLEKIVGEVSDIFKAHMHPEQGDKLYILITTDHGMETIEHLCSLKHAMGRWNTPDPDPVRALWSGSLANIYLNDVPGPQREKVKQSILENLRKCDYMKVWTREELPEKWGYNNPTRTGDIVVSLNPGYYFSNHDYPEPVPVTKDPKALKGMHGYDPEGDDKMLGFMVLSQWGSDEPGRDVGKVDTMQIHPTVAKLLGIQPAAGATAKPIEPLPQ